MDIFKAIVIGLLSSLLITTSLCMMWFAVNVVVLLKVYISKIYSELLKIRLRG